MHRFELWTSWSQTRRSTKLNYTPRTPSIPQEGEGAGDALFFPLNGLPFRFGLLALVQLCSHYRDLGRPGPAFVSAFADARRAGAAGSLATRA